MPAGSGDTDSAGRGGSPGRGGSRGGGGGGEARSRRNKERNRQRANRERLGGDRHDGAGTGAGMNVAPGHDLGGRDTPARTLLGILSHFVGPKGEKGFKDQKAGALDPDFQRRKKTIKPIADPEAGDAERRKKSARRRNQGRLGTLLSQPSETLG